MCTLYNAIQNSGSPIELSEESFTKTFVFDDKFIGFDGHFPGNPILPAMIQLMLGEISAAEATGKPLKTTDVARAKFVMQVGPGDEITVTGKITQKNDATKVNVTLTVGGETASTYILTLAITE
jgi:3-hydroxymyristoyl/3-hydroxydecanoyl-(acyl carrier protein) dehydratase